MMTRILAMLGFAAVLFSFDANAQSPQRSADLIKSFEVQGISIAMEPERARQILLDAGFAEKRGGDTWGQVPTASFTKDNLTVAITHIDGTIYSLSEVRISTGEQFDFSDVLARIREHFNIPEDDPACVVRDYGTRCGFGDGVPKGARFLASLTTQMISIQYGSPP